MDIEEKRKRQRAATQRWRERNPEKVKEADRRPRIRIYDPTKGKICRKRRLLQPGYRERINKQAIDRYRKIKEFLNQYKLEKGCNDCGYRVHPAALEFDHINGSKDFNVAFAKSISHAKKEIKKCVVRCANCHRIRHYEEGRSPSTDS